MERPRLAAARAPASSAEVSGSCSLIGSRIWCPIVCTGFSAFIAPWNTTATRRHRRSRIARSSSPISSVPSSTIDPVIVADSGSSWGIASAAVVLPHPDSPARPNTSPASRLRSTPPTASIDSDSVW